MPFWEAWNPIMSHLGCKSPCCPEYLYYMQYQPISNSVVFSEIRSTVKVLQCLHSRTTFQWLYHSLYFIPSCRYCIILQQEGWVQYTKIFWERKREGERDHIHKTFIIIHCYNYSVFIFNWFLCLFYKLHIIRDVYV